MTRDDAWALLTKYNSEPFHLQHAQTVEGVMRWYAQKLGYDPDYWGIVGLLHDLDFEQWPDEHCVKSQELMREAGVDEDIIRSTGSHGYGICADIKPEHEMEKILFASDELTGLIGAAALMRPAKAFRIWKLKASRRNSRTNALRPDAPETLSETARTSWAGHWTSCSARLSKR